MLSRRASLRSAIAALGVGAALALSAGTPAFAANEGDHWLNTPNCTADQKIELHLYNGVYHDAQAIDPTYVNGSCEFVLTDNGSVIYDSTKSSQSPWYYDGPGHTICAKVTEYNYNGRGTNYTANGVCN
ncbi:hypothetical protein OU787_33570 [Kitasatospora sp. YST-16]|uniref:hypothetical protein n=1 Tax=Kitasatospora sp. YST-16 TaxID=2998080 RepID=UPI0022848BC4|nr:hypothetical protein [Kitasatospora sp. YST-16]WAL76049.1 hypothetical protein OU787_33570 [Kitasatospora sp. YST-16]WNW42102.1 hypothetical protein RKE32_33460 [Streptomyces sp. Li-HN-5-13]